MFALMNTAILYICAKNLPNYLTRSPVSSTRGRESCQLQDSAQNVSQWQEFRMTISGNNNVIVVYQLVICDHM